MAESNQNRALPSVISAFNNAEVKAYREINIATYSIHDILDGNGNCPVTLGNLQNLIHNQAALHMAQAIDDQGRLRELLLSRANTLRGFVLHGAGAGPVAYLIYYPMIDSKGSRVAYCEDFYINEAFRGHGTAKILFHELAKRTIADNFEYIQWATDRRNAKVHGFVQNKLGAKHPDVITISANSLLKGKPPLTNSWSGKNYITRALKENDVNLPAVLGLSPNIIRNTGDLPFKGFVTFERKNPHAVVAITPGWVHLSTFQLKEGLHLEQPVFAAGCNQAGVIASVIEASRKYASNRLDYFRWHIDDNKDSVLRSLLVDRLGLQCDSMLSGQPESELIVYTLGNGALTKLSQEEPDRVLRIAYDDPIGVRKPGPYTPGNDSLAKLGYEEPDRILRIAYDAPADVQKSDTSPPPPQNKP